MALVPRIVGVPAMQAGRLWNFIGIVGAEAGAALVSLTLVSGQHGS